MDGLSIYLKQENHHPEHEIDTDDSRPVPQPPASNHIISSGDFFSDISTHGDSHRFYDMEEDDIKYDRSSSDEPTNDLSIDGLDADKMSESSTEIDVLDDAARRLELKEKIHQHGMFIDWMLTGQNATHMEPPRPTLHTHIKMTRHPSIARVPLDALVSDYGACDFRQELALFVTRHNFTHFTANQHRNFARKIILPFQHTPVFHEIKFWLSNPQLTVNSPQILDVAHVRPRMKRKTKQDSWRGERFDTVLVKLNDETRSGIQRYRVAQVRVVFLLPQNALDVFIREEVAHPKHLAYVEWFSDFRRDPEENHLMYKISRSLKDGKKVASIIPSQVSIDGRSVVLFPQFGPASREWSGENVLEKCTSFYVNPFTDHHSHLTIR